MGTEIGFFCGTALAWCEGEREKCHGGCPHLLRANDAQSRWPTEKTGSASSPWSNYRIYTTRRRVSYDARSWEANSIEPLLAPRARGRTKICIETQEKREDPAVRHFWHTFFNPAAPSSCLSRPSLCSYFALTFAYSTSDMDVNECANEYTVTYTYIFLYMRNRIAILLTIPRNITLALHSIIIIIICLKVRSFWKKAHEIICKVFSV